MPFDYNSFLQGVQTGLRLGRTTKYRPPPTPPVPGGVYILTEDGTPTIAEKKDYGEVTVLVPGEYEAILYSISYIDSPVQDTGSLTITPHEGSSSTPKVFYVCNTSGLYINRVRFFVYCDASVYSPGDRFDYSFVGGTWRRNGNVYLGNPPAEMYGIVYTIWDGEFARIRPVGTGIFYGSDDEAAYWAANSPNSPLITEGG